jgi:hypothetical protein
MLLITIFLALLLLVTSTAGEVYKIIKIGTWTNPDSGNKYNNVWRSSDILDLNDGRIHISQEDSSIALQSNTT